MKRMKSALFLCKILSFNSIVASDSVPKRLNIIDEAELRKAKIEKNEIKSTENAIAIKNLEESQKKQNLLIYEQQKKLFHQEYILNQQKRKIETQQQIIEEQNEELKNVGLKLNESNSESLAIKNELDRIQKDLEANKFDPCIYTCSKSLEGITPWQQYENGGYVSRKFFRRSLIFS